MSKIAIIGAGIIGLTCAEELVKAGHSPTVFYDTSMHHTTSYKAGAIWYPYKIETDENALNWAFETYNILNKKITNQEKGYFLTSLHQYYDEKPTLEKWMSSIEDFQLHKQADNKQSFDLKGFAFATQMNLPLIDPAYVMKELTNSLLSNNVTFEYDHIESLESDKNLIEFDAIINCTGLGAKKLVNDNSLLAGRGQVLLASNPNLKHSSVYAKSDNELCYIFPRGDYCVIGGSYEMDNLSIDEDRELTQTILKRAYKFEPTLEGQAILDIKVGFRPVRPIIRLEQEIISDRLIIHNYGHGGAGWSFAWGCAKEVLKLLK